VGLYLEVCYPYLPSFSYRFILFSQLTTHSSCSDPTNETALAPTQVHSISHRCDANTTRPSLVPSSAAALRYPRRRPLDFASPPAPRHPPSDLRGGLHRDTLARRPPPARHPFTLRARPVEHPPHYLLDASSLPPRNPHPHRVAGETSSAVRNVRATFKAFCRESANSSGASRASTPLLRLVWELPQRCVCVRGASGGQWGLKMLRLGELRDVWMGGTQVGSRCARASYCRIEAR
jgi:hypothetical protein